MKIPASQPLHSSAFAALDCLPIKAIVFGEGGQILFANRIWRKYFGGILAREGDHWWSALALETDKSGFSVKWQEAASAASDFHSTVTLRPPSQAGEAREHLVEIAPFRHSASPALWCACFTEARELLPENPAGSADMQKLLLATISHELRTPLFTLLGWAKVLQELSPFKNPALSQAIDAIEKNSLQAAQIVEDTLDLSRLIRGMVKLDRSRCSLDALTRKAMEKTKSVAEKKRILLKIHSGNSPGYVFADSEMLAKAIQKVISSALKLCSNDGTLKLALKEVDGQLLLWATCDLNGADPDSAPLITDWLDPAEKICQGVVLGLGWAKRILAMHNGSLVARSAGLGKGSSFLLRLPAVR